MKLEELRKQLDEIDNTLMETLGRRFSICREVAVFKRDNGVPLMQPGRMAVVKQRVSNLAEKHDINPEFASTLYDLIIAEACRLEEEVIG